MPDVDILGAATLYAVFVGHTVCHEAAHAYVAWRQGDDTARREGLVTLSPIPHMRREPFGMVLLPLMGAFLFDGRLIGFGSCPINAARMRNPRLGMLLSAAAGPFTNLAIALIAFALIRMGLAAGVFDIPTEVWRWRDLVAPAPGSGPVVVAAAAVLSVAFMLGILLFVFNVLPVPPLDGSTVLRNALPPDLARTYVEGASQMGFVLFILLLVAFNKVWPLIQFAVVRLLYAGA